MKNYDFSNVNLKDLEFNDDMDDQPDNTYMPIKLGESGQILITDDQPADAKDP